MGYTPIRIPRIIDHDSICRRFWKASFDYLSATNQSKTLMNVTYYWSAFLFSVHDILDQNDLTQSIQDKFVSSARTLFQISMDDVETLATLKQLQKATFDTLMSNGFEPTSNEAIVTAIELAGFLNESAEEHASEDIDPSHILNYTLIIKELTEYIVKLFPKQAPQKNSAQDWANKLAPKEKIPEPVPESSSSQSSTEFLNLWLILLGIIVLLALLIGLTTSCEKGSSDDASYKPTNNSIRVTTPTATTRPTVTAPALDPVPEPRTGYIFKTASARVAPLTIKTSGSDGYYFVLEHCTNSFKTMKFYVRGGDTLELDVPLGRYKLYYASGDTWYGEDNLFGPFTVYQECDDVFAFTEDSYGYNGWTLTLYPTYNGNLDTNIIDKDKFPT